MKRWIAIFLLSLVIPGSAFAGIVQHNTIQNREDAITALTNEITNQSTAITELSDIITKLSDNYTVLQGLYQAELARVKIDELRPFSSAEELQDFLLEDKTDEHEYKEPEYDCDDFTLDLMSAAMMQKRMMFTDIVNMGRQHIRCIAFVREGDRLQVWIVEPQTDEMVFYSWVD